MVYQTKINDMGRDESVFEELKNFDHIKMDVIPKKIFYGELKQAFLVVIAILFIINFTTTFIGATLVEWSTKEASLFAQIWGAFVFSLLFTFFQFLFVGFGCVNYVYYKKGLLQYFKRGEEILVRYHQYLFFVIKVYLVVIAVMSLFFYGINFPEAILYAPQIFGFLITAILCNVMFHIELKRLDIPHALEGFKKAFGISSACCVRDNFSPTSCHSNARGDIPKTRLDDKNRFSDDASSPNQQAIVNNQNDSGSNSFSAISSQSNNDFSGSFNPATGLPMTGGGVDIGGNPFGTGE